MSTFLRNQIKIYYESTDEFCLDHKLEADEVELDPNLVAVILGVKP